MEIKKGQSGRKHQYALSFKRMVCEELLGGTISIGEIARKYSIPGAGTIMRWVKWYQADQSDIVKLAAMTTDPVPSENDEDQYSPAAFNKLREELKLAKIKALTLETMIDIADQEFNIQIRKKSGTKPSVE